MAHLITSEKTLRELLAKEAGKDEHKKAVNKAVLAMWKDGELAAIFTDDGVVEIQSLKLMKAVGNG